MLEPIVMRAAVCHAFEQPLRVQQVRLDPPQAEEVRVRIAACAICHSDIHLIQGDWAASLPLVAGHEAAGVVESVGPGVTHVQPGQPVVISLLRQCGHCFFCTIGRPYDCEHDFPLNHETRLYTLDGHPIVQGIRCGAFAEYAVIHSSQVVPIPADMPLDAASLLACGVITGVGAATNTAQVRPGSTVVVIGCGGVGLNTIQGAALCGAAQILAVDLVDAKLEAARQFGATHVVNPTRTDLAQVVAELTQGRGVDYAFATVGNPRVIEQCVALLRRGGTAVLVGMPPDAAVDFRLNAHHVVYGRTLTGSNMGSTRLHTDIPRLIQLYRHGRLRLDELISGHFSLEEINTAIAQVEQGSALRHMIVFDQFPSLAIFSQEPWFL